MWFPYNDAIGAGNEIKNNEHNGICVAKQIEEGFLKSEKKMTSLSVVYALMMQVSVPGQKGFYP